MRVTTPPAIHTMPKRPIQPLTWLLFALIVATAVAGSLWWVQQNVVLVGRDSAGHLEQSVFTQQALQEGGVQGVFRAITLDDYRPPALYLLTQISYALFGQSMDAAQYTNIALLALILALTFVLARTILTDGWALLATALVALLPMITAMTRLYYMENLLTVALLLNLLALLRSDGFRRRGWSLLWGVALGLALLEKWTAPIYMGLPTLYVLWRANRFAEWRTGWRGLRIHWQPLLLAAGVALALALAWYLPNRAQAAQMRMPLGDWLPVLWFALWLPLLYGLFVRGGTLTNFVTASLLALAIASIWYLPRIDFLNRLGAVAFGTDRGTQEAWNLLRVQQYTRYFGYWLSHHMGPLATLLIIPPALLGWWRIRHNLRAPRLVVAVLWLAVLAAWLLLTLVAQANPRNLVPLLPLIAILLVEGLRALGKPLAQILAVVWLLVLGAQWAIYTFDALAPFYARTARLWVHGDYTAWPRSGSSDVGYWIHPEVLEIVDREAGDPATLGMLIDAWEIHRGAFRYLVTAQGANVQVNALTEDNMRGWSDLFANEWLLAKNGDNRDVKPPGQALLAAIAEGDPFFHRLYAPVREWTLPSGEVATLYRRSEGPPRPLDFPVVLIETAAIADAVRERWTPGATLYFTDADTAAWVAIHDLQAQNAAQVLIPADPQQPVASALEGVSGTIFAISRYRTAEVQEYLRAQGYTALEVGDGEFHLTIATIPAQPLAAAPVLSAWDAIVVATLHTTTLTTPGAVLPIDLTFAGAPDGALKMSLRLRNEAGEDVAQQDVTVLPAARAALFIPRSLPAGAYTLGGILYDPTTLAPLPDTQGNEFAPLVVIQVGEQ